MGLVWLYLWKKNNPVVVNCVRGLSDFVDDQKRRWQSSELNQDFTEDAFEDVSEVHEPQFVLEDDLSDVEV